MSMIHLWEPTSGSWTVDPISLAEDTARVEDLQVKHRFTVHQLTGTRWFGLRRKFLVAHLSLGLLSLEGFQLETD